MAKNARRVWRWNLVAIFLASTFLDVMKWVRRIQYHKGAVSEASIFP